MMHGKIFAMLDDMKLLICLEGTDPARAAASFEYNLDLRYTNYTIQQPQRSNPHLHIAVCRSLETLHYSYANISSL